MHSTIISVRKYRPLSMSFPAPGVYHGKIMLVLPGPDRTILSRLAGEGSSPIVIEIEVESITALDIYELVTSQIPALEQLSRKFSRPLFEKLYALLSLSVSRQDRRDYAAQNSALGGSSNPLEAPPDNMRRLKFVRQSPERCLVTGRLK